MLPTYPSNRLLKWTRPSNPLRTTNGLLYWGLRNPSVAYRCRHVASSRCLCSLLLGLIVVSSVAHRAFLLYIRHWFALHVFYYALCTRHINTTLLSFAIKRPLSLSLSLSLKPRLHDTTGCFDNRVERTTTRFDNRFDSRLYRVNGASPAPASPDQWTRGFATGLAAKPWFHVKI